MLPEQGVLRSRASCLAHQHDDPVMLAGRGGQDHSPNTGLMCATRRSRSTSDFWNIPSRSRIEKPCTAFAPASLLSDSASIQCASLACPLKSALPSCLSVMTWSTAWSAIPSNKLGVPVHNFSCLIIPAALQTSPPSMYVQDVTQSSQGPLACTELPGLTELMRCILCCPARGC